MRKEYIRSSTTTKNWRKLGMVSMDTDSKGTAGFVLKSVILLKSQFQDSWEFFPKNELEQKDILHDKLLFF